MNFNEFVFILMIIIFTLFIINLSECYFITQKESFDNSIVVKSTENYMKIDRNNDLINRYRKYNEDLKYYMHIHFDYYVKDTNKPYAQYVTELDRNRTYYEEKLKTLKYPFIIRKEKDGYYIDYQLPNGIINNKVEDILWNDFNSPTKILITLYDAPENFIKQISNILKDYDNIEYQYSNSKVDMLYDNYIYTRRVLNDIGETLLPLGKQIITDLQLEEKIKQIKLNAPNIEQNIQLQVENKLGKDFTDYLKTQIKPKIELEIKEKTPNLTSEIKTEIERKIKDITPYVKQESLKYLNKIDVSDIQLFTNNSYIEMSLETRNYRYIYIFDKNDPNAPDELINLVRVLNDPENLDQLNDKYTKDLRYYRVPINIMRVIIKFGEYLKLF